MAWNSNMAVMAAILDEFSSSSKHQVSCLQIMVEMLQIPTVV
jgi:hypothetical protein